MNVDQAFEVLRQHGDGFKPLMPSYDEALAAIEKATAYHYDQEVRIKELEDMLREGSEQAGSLAAEVVRLRGDLSEMQEMRDHALDESARLRDLLNRDKLARDNVDALNTVERLEAENARLRELEQEWTEHVCARVSMAVMGPYCEVTDRAHHEHLHTENAALRAELARAKLESEEFAAMMRAERDQLREDLAASEITCHRAEAELQRVARNNAWYEPDGPTPLERVEGQRDDLLAALREITDWKLPGQPDVYECRHIARAAIERYEGTA